MVIESGEFSPNTARLTASRPGDTVAHREKGGLNFLYPDRVPRHPSQLYEFALEGLALFAILWWFSMKPRPRGAVSGLFLIGYGLFRFGVEYTREPDRHLGLLTLGLSMGQWLSLPMIVAGAALLAWAYRNAKRQPA